MVKTLLALNGKNEFGACELFVSHLLWKEIVEGIWKPTFHFRKQTRF